jgi:proline dehydrogenase
MVWRDTKQQTQHEKTFNLGKHEYRAFKYVPYGEVDEVMPYLLRRARENSAIVGGATIELDMITAELGRRFKGGQVSKQVES